MQANQGSRKAREKLFHRLFLLGIWLKGLNGIVQIAGGILLLTVSLESLNQFVIQLTGDEIEEDSGDLIAKALRQAVNHMTPSSKVVAGLYLVANGIVRVFLAYGILRGKLWYFPVGMGIISVFVVGLIARLTFHFTYLVFFLVLINIAVILLIWREYKRLRRARHAR